MKSEVFPLGLRLAGLRCLVVGSGDEAGPRAEALAAAGAQVVSVTDRPFVEADLDGVWLAVLTDMDRELGERMFHAACARRIFFCAVDQPDFGTFSHLALAREGDLTVAISTNGKAPALARRLREELARVLSAAGLAAFVSRLAALRDRTASADRRRVLGDAVKGVHFSGQLELPKDV